MRPLLRECPQRPSDVKRKKKKKKQRQLIWDSGSVQDIQPLGALCGHRRHACLPAFSRASRPRFERPCICALSTVLRLPPARTLRLQPDFPLPTLGRQPSAAALLLNALCFCQFCSSLTPFQVLEFCLHFGNQPFPSGSGHPWCDPQSWDPRPPGRL